ncbi:hypothetical protein GE09DRAFT_406506 [Coniochaeta sp. 2T2.1]|nr:hypothetical protein GE09DRAFT_406506 [Coniochaeta sp. 2T2.1]
MPLSWLVGHRPLRRDRSLSRRSHCPGISQEISPAAPLFWLTRLLLIFFHMAFRASQTSAAYVVELDVVVRKKLPGLGASLMNHLTPNPHNRLHTDTLSRIRSPSKLARLAASSLSTSLKLLDLHILRKLGPSWAILDHLEPCQPPMRTLPRIDVASLPMGFGHDTPREDLCGLDPWRPPTLCQPMLRATRAT